MDPIKVSKIRPVSWRIHVQGKTAAERVQQSLVDAGMQVTMLGVEPTLDDPPVYPLLATPAGAGSITQAELSAILKLDEQVELTFEESAHE